MSGIGSIIVKLVVVLAIAAASVVSGCVALFTSCSFDQQGDYIFVDLGLGLLATVGVGVGLGVLYGRARARR